MKILALDWETTGKEPAIARPIELGAILFDSDTWEELEMISYLLQNPIPPLHSEVVEVTGITDQELLDHGVAFTSIIPILHGLMDQADYVLAHNAEYDKMVYEEECRRLGVEPRFKIWICSYKEIPYPARLNCKKLSHLALDHGIAVDPKNLHRAIEDVRLLIQLLREGGYTLDKILDYRAIPWVHIQAQVNYDNRQLAKDRRFSWEKIDNVVYPKKWVKRVKKCDVDKEREGAPFQIEILREEAV